MSEWWTYRLDDFLLFSERSYWRLFELHNEAFWPAQIPALAFGLAILALALRPRPWSGRVVALILAALWAFVAWAFLWNTYLTINWAASYVAPFFLVEAALLAWLGGSRRRLILARERNAGTVLGLILLVYAFGIHPLTALAAGRPAASAEIFGLTPDPTAIATLGFLSIVHGGVAVWLLLPVPLAWCLLSWATLHALGTWQAWIPLAAIALTLVAHLRGRGGDRKKTGMISYRR